MKTLFLLCGLVLFIPACSEDHPTRASQGIITGKVLYADSSKPAEGAVVYLLEPPFCSFVDSLVTVANGWYRFENLRPRTYCVSAAKSGEPNDLVWSHVSRMSEDLHFNFWMYVHADDIYLHEVSDQATISGSVTYRGTGAPADSADVILYKFAGGRFVTCDDTLTNNEGSYLFTNVQTGNYYVFARCVAPNSPPGYTIYWETDSDLFFCDGLSGHSVEKLELGEYDVKKPAIYIYPPEDSFFEVELIFENGTALTNSIPEYGSGWKVFVEKSGRIDQTYDYLFYEASMGGTPVLTDGWCLRRNELPYKLRLQLTRVGLNAKEAADFVAYWLDYLTEYDCYRIYPQFDRELDDMVGLRVTPEPDAMLRVWLYFEGCEDCGDLPRPSIPEFYRGEITVVEWGGALLN